MASAIAKKFMLLLFLLAATVCFLLFAAFPLLTAQRQTARLPCIWRQFTSAVADGDTARNLTAYPGPKWLYWQFTDSRLTYCGRDVTDVIAQSKISYRTSMSNLTGPPQTKIVFDRGCAIVESGRIEWIKLP